MAIDASSASLDAVRPRLACGAARLRLAGLFVEDEAAPAGGTAVR
jgi:hypothetical protein